MQSSVEELKMMLGYKNQTSNVKVSGFYVKY